MNTAVKNITTVEKAINQHILDCVYSETYYRYGKLEDAKNRLKNEFEKFANYECSIKITPNIETMFEDYLKTVPFKFYFYYDSYKINNFLNSLDLNIEEIKHDKKKPYKLYSYLIFKQMYSSVKHE